MEDEGLEPVPLRPHLRTVLLARSQQLTKAGQTSKQHQAFPSDETRGDTDLGRLRDAGGDEGKTGFLSWGASRARGRR